MQLSRLENEAYEKLRKNQFSVFGIRDLKILMGVSDTKVYNIVKAMKKKKLIENIGKRKFAFRDADEMIVSTQVNWPSYISFWTALSYYGFSDQMPKKIYCASTKYSKEIKNFRYIVVSKERFFGYIKIGEIIIAEKEKAIIDSLLFPKYSGGIKEIEKSIKSGLKELDIEKLIKYSLKIKSKAVLRRLGYILEKAEIKEKELNKLLKKIGRGYELLDPSLKRKNNLNKRWGLDINI